MFSFSFLEKRNSVDGKTYTIIHGGSIVNRSEPCFIFQLSGFDTPLALGLLVSWSLGLIGKHAIISNSVRTGLQFRPVNRLILVDQVINLVHRSVSPCGKIAMKKTPAEITSPPYSIHLLKNSYSKSFGNQKCLI